MKCDRFACGCVALWIIGRILTNRAIGLVSNNRREVLLRGMAEGTVFFLEGPEAAVFPCRLVVDVVAGAARQLRSQAQDYVPGVLIHVAVCRGHLSQVLGREVHGEIFEQVVTSNKGIGIGQSSAPGPGSPPLKNLFFSNPVTPDPI